MNRGLSPLLSPVSIGPLITLRIITGILMTFSTLRFMALGWIEDHYILPVFHFRYPGWEWVPLLSSSGIYLLHFLMLIAGIMVILGWYYKVAIWSLLISFTWLELIDVTYYLNHYYFVSLLLLAMTLVPAAGRLSMDSFRNSKLGLAFVPAWQVGMFRIFLGVVYLYAGIAKINYDWLFEGLPLRIWLPANEHWPLVGPYLKSPWVAIAFSWSGMFYDLSIPFLLAWRKTRRYAWIGVIVFHLLTALMFQIGVFPWVMIGASLIFFSDPWHERLHEKISNWLSIPFQEKPILLPSFQVRYGLILAMIGLLFHLIFPFRYMAYPGSLYWTEEGYRFGWRVMVMEKAGTATFYVLDRKTGREGVVDNREFLNDHQEKQMAMQPDMILQYAHFLGDTYKALGMKPPQVRAEVYVTLNGRPSALFVNPKVDLMQVKSSDPLSDWILPSPDTSSKNIFKYNI